jgi:hypothetical protein
MTARMNLLGNATVGLSSSAFGVELQGIYRQYHIAKVP